MAGFPGEVAHRPIEIVRRYLEIRSRTRCLASLPCQLEAIASKSSFDAHGAATLSEVVILHNPRCSKSRATLDLLTQRGIQPRIVDYLKDPPSPEELERILSLLGLTAREFMRRGDEEYRTLGLHDERLGHADLLAALCAHPRLIERPIVIANGKAAIGRPPESVLDIL